jgi:hypothetical protein
MAKLREQATQTGTSKQGILLNPSKDLVRNALLFLKKCLHSTGVNL